MALFHLLAIFESFWDRSWIATTFLITLSMAYKELSILTPSLRSLAFPQKSLVSFLNRSLRNLKKNSCPLIRKAIFPLNFHCPRKTVEWNFKKKLFSEQISSALEKNPWIFMKNAKRNFRAVKKVGWPFFRLLQKSSLRSLQIPQKRLEFFIKRSL